MARGTTVHRNGVDTWVGSGAPAANHAGARNLWLESNARFAYLYFNRPFPLGATILSATLRTYVKGDWGGSHTLEVRRLIERFSVSRVTWNNRPNVGAVLKETTQGSNTDGRPWAFDVTELMQSVADGGAWFGFRLASSTAATPIALWASEGPADHRPELEVTWTTAPQAPTTLSPSGGEAVAVDKPVVRFDFTDNIGSTALQQVHVQVTTPTGDWSVGFDSGPVVTTEPELDLAAAGYGGLPAGGTRRWRVRVQDAAGLWSAWSDPATFTYETKGNLTILNPGAAPDDFVWEWTPPIIWDFTGRTQRGWQLFVTPADDPTNRLYDTGRTNSNHTSWRLPAFVIEDESRYRVVVRVWDTLDRRRPAWVQAEREFTFKEDPTPNPVTNLTATNLLPRPWVDLRFERATAPDYFAIKRDGRVIATDVRAHDLLLPDGTYRYRDREAASFRQHTWAVQSVVNGKTSAANPTVTTRPIQQGIWLYDRDRDLEVFIQGKDEGSWGMGEDATTHYPLGATQGVRITQSLRGFEGSITGTLTDALSKTADYWENQLLAIKSRPGEPVTLSVGNEAFRAIVHNVSVAPTPTMPITKAVSFEFFQVGRLGWKPRL